MRRLILRGSPALSQFRLQNLLQDLATAGIPARAISAEFVHVAEISGELTAPEHTILEKLLTYGTGRGLGFSDRPAVTAIVATSAKQEYGFRSLIHEVVQSPTFQQK